MSIPKINFTLLLIIILAFFLRFYQLGSNPPSLNWDETAEGYNAFSILKTGKDEYGYKLPLYFRSFDDYKPPLYTYLVVPSIVLFGLDNFTVRFPSALLGVGAVLFTYLMVYELFKNKKIALLASFFLAVSPWHLQFSRVGFETNSAIFFSTFGTWAFLKGVSSKNIKIMLWMIVAALAFGANLFMYHNARVFIPIFSLGLLFLYRHQLLNNKRYLMIPFLIALIFSIILLPIIFSKAGQTRYQGTTIFGDVSPLYKNSETILVDENNGALGIARLIHNRRFVYIPILIKNYISHFNPNFLFFEADMDRHHAPLMGLLYFWDLPFILAGLYLLIKRNWQLNTKIIVLLWFALAPVASSVTWGVPHSLRSEIYLPTYQIFIAIGSYFVLHKILFQKVIKIAIILIASAKE